MKTEVEKIIRLLNKSFDKGAWHGPTVREILAQVKSDNAFNRLPNTHSIIELVGHMTTWRNYVTSRILGNTDFTVSPDINFPSSSDWAEVLKDLEKSHTELIKASEDFPDEKLSELVPAASHKYTFYTMLHGIIHHDLYHAGQIIIINNS
jgi:uncharacterized damage-inducible protein DinB